MKKIWVHKSKSFKEAEEFDRLYYFEMSPAQRLDIVQELREMYFKFPKQRRHPDKGLKNASRKRLRRVIKIVQ